MRGLDYIIKFSGLFYVCYAFIFMVAPVFINMQEQDEPNLKSHKNIEEITIDWLTPVGDMVLDGIKVTVLESASRKNHIEINTRFTGNHTNHWIIIPIGIGMGQIKRKCSTLGESQ